MLHLLRSIAAIKAGLPTSKGLHFNDDRYSFKLLINLKLPRPLEYHLDTPEAYGDHLVGSAPE
jgi:hypothetical protein